MVALKSLQEKTKNGGWVNFVSFLFGVIRVIIIVIKIVSMEKPIDKLRMEKYDDNNLSHLNYSCYE